MKCFDEKWGRLPSGALRGICLLCLFVLLISGCTNIEGKNNLELEKNSSGLTDQNIEWLKNVHSGSPLLAYYHPFAVMLYEDEWHLTRDEIEHRLYDLDIKKRTVLGVYEHSSTQLFEIGEYTLSDRAVLTYLTAYTKYDEKWLRQLEVLYKKDNGSVDVEESGDMADDIEQSWAESIALKDAKQLVESLFWDNARYVNLLSGGYTNSYNELFDVYGFVELPDAQFSVEVQDIYVVRDDLVYIIGQYYAGPGHGYYALIRTKNEQDAWKNILDTNY